MIHFTNFANINDKTLVELKSLAKSYGLEYSKCDKNSLIELIEKYLFNQLVSDEKTRYVVCTLIACPDYKRPEVKHTCKILDSKQKLDEYIKKQKLSYINNHGIFEDNTETPVSLEKFDEMFDDGSLEDYVYADSYMSNYPISFEVTLF